MVSRATDLLADRNEQLAVPAGAIAEDALPVWARGFAAPALAPGETKRVPLVRSLATARLEHVPVAELIEATRCYAATAVRFLERRD